MRKFHKMFKCAWQEWNKKARKLQLQLKVILQQQQQQQ